MSAVRMLHCFFYSMKLFSNHLPVVEPGGENQVEDYGKECYNCVISTRCYVR